MVWDINRGEVSRWSNQLIIAQELNNLGDTLIKSHCVVSEA